MHEFAPNYDHLHGYMEQNEQDMAHWSLFNHNITSSEPNVEDVLKLLKNCKDELFDLRPYMIDQPVKLDLYAHLGEAL